MGHDFFDDDFDDDPDEGELGADVPEEIRVAFRRDMEAFERAEPTPPLDALEKSGVEMPPSDQLTDQELRETLWRSLRGLAFLGVYLHHTDHLSDRQLYTQLREEALRRPVVMMPENPNFGYHLDLVDGESEEDEQLYLRYYADEETRERWAEQFPATDMPPAERRPFDRDRLLPRHSPIELAAGDAS